MNRKPLMSGIIAACLLAGCAAQPPQDYYYSLVLAGDGSARTSTPEPGARLIVGPIHLPRYLNQRGMVMQLDGHQIQTANHHFWAEPLDEAIGKVLVQDIAQRNTSLEVGREQDRWSGTGNCRLRVEFDKFHATNAARVAVRGRYWLYAHDATPVSQTEFDIAEALTDNGYDHAVTQLRVALGELSVEVSESVRSSKVCTQSSVLSRPLSSND